VPKCLVWIRPKCLLLRSFDSTLKRKTTSHRHLVESSFFYDDVPPLDDLSPNDKLTPPILSQWIRAKGESFGSVYLVKLSRIFPLKDMGTGTFLRRVVCDWSLVLSCVVIIMSTIFFVSKQVELFLMLQFPDWNC